MRRNFRAMGGLVAAMEADEEIEGLPQVDTEPGADGLEAALLETSEELPVGEAEATGIDDTLDATDQLEDIKEVAEAAQEKGGLDVPAAEMMRISVESICDRLGMGRTRATLPAMESFGGTGSRVTATNLAIEEIKDTIKTAWEAIVKAIKRAVEWIMGYYNKFFGAAERLKKRAAALQSKEEGMTTGIENTTFENGSLFKALQVKGEVAEASLPAELEKVKALITGVNGVVTAAVKDDDALVGVMGSLDKAGTFQATIPPNLPTGDGSVHGEAGDGYKFVTSEELPGGQAVVAYIPSATPAAGQASLEAVARMYYTVTKHNPKAAEVTKAKFTTAARPVVKKIAVEAVAIAEEALNFRKILDKAKATLSKLATSASKDLSSAQKDEEKGAEAKALLEAVKKAVASSVKRLGTDPAKVTGYAVRTAAAAVQYGELSLANYKKA